VCGQAVDQLPAETHLKLDELKAASDSAQEEAARTQDARNTADRQVALKQQEIENLDKNFEDAGAERRSVLAELAAVLPDPETPLDEMTRRLAEMDKAKSRIDALESDEKTLSAKREERAAAIAHAQQDVTRLEIEWQSHTGDAEKALKQAADAEATVREAAEARGWESVLAAIKQGAPAADVLRRDLQDSQTQEAATNQAIGAGRIRIERIEADIETAKAIRQEEREHREKAVLARDLATLLRADRFPAFIRDEAMKTLAAGGSEWLQKISQGRYDLIVEGQDFEVEDQWNAGSRRSVKTLSGGETFMASLSLALALAEQLPGLAGEGGASALESLFIDEGFSNLDTQTLDDVASALEVLGQDRRRLIGVITHVPALAERMPARITVHKSQTGSTVSVE
jgi:exonuclease SbcC